MVKKYFVILLLLLSGPVIFAQQGFGGKKFYIYITPISGIKSVFSSINVEYLLLRNITISAGFNYFTSKYKQDVYSTQIYAYKDEIPSVPGKAKVTTMGGSIELRKYFNSVIELPAPKGFFCFAGFKYGNLNVEGNYNHSLTEYLDGVENSNIAYEYKNLGSYSIEAGLGNHWFLNKYIVTGFKLGLGFNKLLKSINANTDKILSPVGTGYGNNLFGFGLNSKYLPTDCNLGLSIYGEIGILLF